MFIALGAWERSFGASLGRLANAAPRTSGEEVSAMSVLGIAVCSGD